MNTYAMLAFARSHSLWLSRQLDHNKLDGVHLAHILAKPLEKTDFMAFADWQGFQATLNESELARQLRILRRYVLAQIMVRDLNRVSDLAEVTRTITEFADFAVNTAAAFAEQYYREMYGTPKGRHTGVAQHLSVVAMGKAGGFELNVSSDIDLIFIYGEAGETDGRRSQDNQTFFTKVGRKIIALLDDITDEGQVFRVDMRLRPDGDSGALVWSETALEQYLMTQGREWERYAWCKGRVVTPYANDIVGVVRPFVFRKYLDYNAYAAMRDLHRQIRAEATKKYSADNIKLGAGGIREVEFVAQIFQMIRGGQHKTLQLKGTQETLQRLAQMQMLPENTVADLLAAYRFLRDVEHRLQYWDDQQTQTLPENAEQQQLLAQSMGFANYAAFSGSLNAHRQVVAQVFAQILAEPEAENTDDAPYSSVWLNADDISNNVATLTDIGFRQPESLAQRLWQLKNSNRYRQLSVQAQPRFDAIVPRLIEAAASTHAPDEAIWRLLSFLETISRRSAYLAFLNHYPQARKQLANLMAQSAWLAEYLQQHPILLDELLSAQLMQPLDWRTLKTELSGSLNACEDTESKMDTLRRFQHAQIFRLAMQDLAGCWTVEALSDELSLLADTILTLTLEHAWQSIPKTHRPDPQFAIIAYGKLGGKELGYTSDLDLVYLYDDPHPEAADHYAKLARRLNTWLSGSTGAGTLYDTDLRLRPDGDNGFIVHSITAFEHYQHEKAWTWEHQALTRARFVCGSETVGKQFENIRRAILTQPRDEQKLHQEIIEMREKMFPTHPPVDSDVKYARGGVVDVEFMVQYLVLAKSATEPALLENYGNIALLGMAARRSLIDADIAQQAADAYRRFRHIQHNTKLRDIAHVQIDETLLADYAVVKTLWQQVFGQAAKAV
ncbi:MAG: bifunctional [glutamate--ammonia ligase]-adenylyl-L-tyrosine phosphorylase/[glutamate--ammonia-ligase] adenylyltransferase [Alysiella sp.]|uniref:bifunctional [glutamate--ammonia ligase]-adenylyl-L-tyrosine phosphorylase/[glutamate--ammonia-ligase] adenylyltransferase n=1 Tax=Alysiella sp. TaxID=1872483 RepID=UPI0026DC4808|nr:bifunctional [glutamate--ammonia ligase]-adenylyl-L-tyrosine phosphorylase/[glutamate--ammonia-ligase] adenylyltransferase [Alysiella sp.]MDO4433120.1 bifunctional [glutamate--ammonia ligase]-adenylyl-L-tyrosine phosphorylase/[glutamate--ammonia-ligase] adenylyltransferase [Alysiella sp.]